MKRDTQGYLIDKKGKYTHPDPPGSRDKEYVQPASFEKLTQAEEVLMAVPGGWDEVELPDEYKNSPQKPKSIYVIWKGSRIKVSLNSLRIPKQNKKKKKRSWFHE